MLSTISPGSLLLILIIVLLLFGTKKLRNIGSDLGSAIKSFRKAVNTNEDLEDKRQQNDDATVDDKKVIEGESQRHDQ